MISTFVYNRPELDSVERICPSNPIFITDIDEQAKYFFKIYQIETDDHDCNFCEIEGYGHHLKGITTFEWSDKFNLYLPLEKVTGLAQFGIIGVYGNCNCEKNKTRYSFGEIIHRDVKPRVMDTPYPQNLFIRNGRLDYFQGCVALIGADSILSKAMSLIEHEPNANYYHALSYGRQQGHFYFHDYL